MKLHFHGDELLYQPEYMFKKIPDGLYSVRTTVESSEGEASFAPFDFQWPVEIREGTLFALPCDVPMPAL